LKAYVVLAAPERNDLVLENLLSPLENRTSLVLVQLAVNGENPAVAAVQLYLHVPGEFQNRWSRP
jgi:hypothetical protein